MRAYQSNAKRHCNQNQEKGLNEVEDEDDDEEED
jgi:hypothetical protein